MNACARLRARAFAATYDRLNAAAERTVMGQRRAELLTAAHSVVVEIGTGTGANLPHYDAAQVQHLLLTEPDPYMRQRLERKIGDAVPRLREAAEVVDGSAEHIDLPDASADVVVSTLVLCSVGDAAVSAAEAVRVLKPGGQLLVLEHVGSESASVRRWQDRLTPIQRRVAGGCHLNRDTVMELRRAGLETGGVKRWELGGAFGRLMPIVEGAVRKPAV
ncbi:class I SAM-dependent methyltransferase [Arthrobacter castelli]|uniref:class I SAM-dependent methyltransferase n=1 Tax=Arthrobacter castelli TaxID=271431 RepID=UPI00041B30F1|nr:class I SAM-dependent methyltransferase [Arthrobacter castelli]